MVVALAQHPQTQPLSRAEVRSILDVHSLCSSAPDDKSWIASSPILIAAWHHPEIMDE
jgi:hypothetical protein